MRYCISPKQKPDLQWSFKTPSLSTKQYVPGSKIPRREMVIPPLIGNPHNGYINPYYLVDDHPLIGVPQNGWFIMENPIKIHDLGGPPLFLETPIYIYYGSLDPIAHIYIYLGTYSHHGPQNFMTESSVLKNLHDQRHTPLKINILNTKTWRFGSDDDP